MRASGKGRQSSLGETQSPLGVGKYSDLTPFSPSGSFSLAKVNQKPECLRSSHELKPAVVSG